MQVAITIHTVVFTDLNRDGGGILHSVVWDGVAGQVGVIDVVRDREKTRLMKKLDSSNQKVHTITGVIMDPTIILIMRHIKDDSLVLAFPEVAMVLVFGENESLLEALDMKISKLK